jgi:DNA invertase Pin-like site-specific DNA recombinase
MTIDDISKVRKLVRSGTPTTEIAAHFNVNQTTILRFMKKYGISGIGRPIGTGQERYGARSTRELEPQ